jgi:hypothetical protein
MKPPRSAVAFLVLDRRSLNILRDGHVLDWQFTNFGNTMHAIDQMKPTISRAIAILTTLAILPRALSRR